MNHHKLGNSKKQITFSVQLFNEGATEDVSVPSEIHVLPTGEFKHPYYGDFAISSAEISKFVENYNSAIRNDLRITAGHDNGMSVANYRLLLGSKSFTTEV